MSRASNNYRIINPETKITFDELFNEVRENITLWEAKMIWYLRKVSTTTTWNFYHAAQKFYEAKLYHNEHTND